MTTDMNTTLCNDCALSYPCDICQADSLERGYNLCANCQHYGYPCVNCGLFLEVKECEVCEVCGIIGHPCDCEACGNCNFHGEPCLNCAEYIYWGELGPGHDEGIRRIPPDTDAEVRAIMVQVAHDDGIDYLSDTPETWAAYTSGRCCHQGESHDSIIDDIGDIDDGGYDSMPELVDISIDDIDDIGDGGYDSMPELVDISIDDDESIEDDDYNRVDAAERNADW